MPVIGKAIYDSTVLYLNCKHASMFVIAYNKLQVTIYINAPHSALSTQLLHCKFR